MLYKEQIAHPSNLKLRQGPISQKSRNFHLFQVQEFPSNFAILLDFLKLFTCQLFKKK